MIRCVCFTGVNASCSDAARIRSGFCGRAPLPYLAGPVGVGIVAAARETDASLAVLGPHRRSGLVGHLQGSVAAAVIAHSTIPVMAIPEQPCRR